MRTYLVTITMADGSQGEHQGLYACGIDAVIKALEQYPEARRVSAKPLATACLGLAWEAA